jgi:hypothetical protein
MWHKVNRIAGKCCFGFMLWHAQRKNITDEWFHVQVTAVAGVHSMLRSLSCDM